MRKLYQLYLSGELDINMPAILRVIIIHDRKMRVFSPKVTQDPLKLVVAPKGHNSTIDSITGQIGRQRTFQCSNQTDFRVVIRCLQIMLSNIRYM